MIQPIEHYEFGVNKARIIDEGNLGRQVAVPTTPTGYFYPPDYTVPIARGEQENEGFACVSTSMVMHPNGTSVYFTKHNGVAEGFGNQDGVAQFNLSIPWDLKTMSVHIGSTTGAASWDAVEASTRQLHFSPDGINLFVAGGSTLKVFRLILSTPYLVTTAVYTSFFSTAITGLYSIHFNTDGTLLFCKGDNNILTRYLLSVPWDITTAVLNGSTLSVLGTFTFSEDGKNIFTNYNSSYIRKYYLATAWDLSSYITFETSPNLSSINITTAFGCPYIRPGGSEIYFNGYTSFSARSLKLTKPYAIQGKLG